MPKPPWQSRKSAENDGPITLSKYFGQAMSLSSFKSKLKTHLFSSAYWFITFFLLFPSNPWLLCMCFCGGCVYHYCMCVCMYVGVFMYVCVACLSAFSSTLGSHEMRCHKLPMPPSSASFWVAPLAWPGLWQWRWGPGPASGSAGLPTPKDEGGPPTDWNCYSRSCSVYNSWAHPTGLAHEHSTQRVGSWVGTCRIELHPHSHWLCKMCPRCRSCQSSWGSSEGHYFACQAPLGSFSEDVPCF